MGGQAILSMAGDLYILGERPGSLGALLLRRAISVYTLATYMPPATFSPQPTP
jgi:hypothetical protein